MIKLLAVDMDGTCLNSDGVMSPETLSALKKAADSGVIVVPTTGRNINCLPVPLKNQSFYKYIISSNGALVVDLENDEEIFKSYIKSETAAKILKKMRTHLIFVAAHIDRDYYVQGRFVYRGVKHFLKDDADKLITVRNMAKAVYKNNKHVEELQLFYFGERYRKIIAKIITPYPEVCVAHSKGYAEIYNKSGSKGTALKALADNLGIDMKDVACIGDEENDLSMFKVAGLPLAMGNAIDEVKKLAKVILPTNNENGVAFAIENYILK